MTVVNSIGIVTVAEIKEALELSGTKDDERIAGYINRVTAIIEKYVNRDLTKATYIEEYSGTGSNIIILKNYPVTDLASVEYMNNADYSDVNWIAFNARDYKLVEKENKVYGLVFLVTGTFSLPLVPGVDNYRVTYTAGHDGNMPEDIKEACISMVSWLFNNHNINPAMKSENLQKYSYSRITAEGGLIKVTGAAAILDFHRDIPV